MLHLLLIAAFESQFLRVSRYKKICLLALFTVSKLLLSGDGFEILNLGYSAVLSRQLFFKVFFCQMVPVLVSLTLCVHESCVCLFVALCVIVVSVLHGKASQWIVLLDSTLSVQSLHGTMTKTTRTGRGMVEPSGYPLSL